MSSIKQIVTSYSGVPPGFLFDTFENDTRSFIAGAFSAWTPAQVDCGDEDQHTARFRAVLLDIARGSARFGNFTVSFNQPIVTDEILSGKAQSKSAAKPDLTVTYWQEDVAHIEAKIVRPVGRATQYVVNGMKRFADECYGSGHTTGYMLGYIHDSSIEDVVASIDNGIAALDDPEWTSLSDGSTAGQGTVFSSRVPRYTQPAMRLLHLLCRCV
ncbi:hypothetical protein [Mycobacteroides abscessus]|uniref:hypothetical protein n=1 Tax=Mycobacteroides abscessus TaxID=36809 RepID=UPI0018969086